MGTEVRWGGGGAGGGGGGSTRRMAGRSEPRLLGVKHPYLTDLPMIDFFLAYLSKFHGLLRELNLFS